jgi:hypothetical protein
VVWYPETPDIMAGDHGAVLAVVNKAVWDSKIQEAKHAGKVVSAFSFFLSFSEVCLSITPLTVGHHQLPQLQLVVISLSL